MVKIYGTSDDLVVIENSDFEESEIGCYDQAVRIHFDDDTVIRVEYGKDVFAIWGITVEVTGMAQMSLHVCENEDDDPHSDVFTIDADVESVEIIPCLGYDPSWMQRWEHD